MVFTYENYRGQKYHLHKMKTKTGKDTYYFAKHTKGDLVDSMPEGYEIYEKPNGQVYIRKEQEKIILDEEINLILNGLKKYTEDILFKLDINGKRVTVYTNEDLKDEFGDGYNFSSEEQYKDFLKRRKYFCEVRFVLMDEKERLFSIQRYSYRSSVDGWIYLESGELKDLIKKYIPHLGYDSFYDFR